MPRAPEGAWDPVMRSLLEHMLKIEASDLYVTAGSPPVFRIDGVGYPAKQPLEAAATAAMAASLMSPQQREEFARALELNFALATASGGRFRANVFRQRGAVGLVIRMIRTTIRTLGELSLPPVLARVMGERRGLVLVVGATGSGKSTTLAAMVDHRNRAGTGHIVTIEDPIEFIHQHQQCIVTQREIGVDTHSYRDALRSALRQAPDLVLIGEIRDAETMASALALAETGHLCVSTLHANNANQAIERMLSFFSSERQAELRLQLALNLRAIVSQRLVPAQGGGRAAALEVLLDTPRIRELIRRGEIEAIKDAMEQGEHEGCATFDAALLALVVAGRISEADALSAADSANNLRLRIDRHRGAGGAPPAVSATTTHEVPTLRLVRPSKPAAIRR